MNTKNTKTACDESARHANAERYALRLMSARESEDFEDHFVSCAACQDEVRLVSAVGAGLRTQPGWAAAAPPRTTRRPVWFWSGGLAGMAIAASLVFMVVRRAPDRALATLGAVAEPPVYLGIPVRSVASVRDSMFDGAMRAYGDHRYAVAASSLLAVVNGGGDAPAPRFFLATSFLVDNRPADAAEQYSRVLDMGESPYRTEAKYYLAKSLLRIGRASDALAALRLLKPADGVTYDMGSALADSVVRVLQRK